MLRVSHGISCDEKCFQRQLYLWNYLKDNMSQKGVLNRSCVKESDILHGTRIYPICLRNGEAQSLDGVERVRLSQINKEKWGRFGTS